MLIQFTDSYEEHVSNAYNIIGKMQANIANLEPWMGKTATLDKSYAHSILLIGLIEYLNSEVASTDQQTNEYFLQCIQTLNSQNICGAKADPILDFTSYRNLQFLPLPEPVNNFNNY